MGETKMSNIDLRDPGHEKALKNMLEILSIRLKNALTWRTYELDKNDWMKITRTIIDEYETFKTCYELKCWPKSEKNHEHN